MTAKKPRHLHAVPPPDEKVDADRALAVSAAPAARVAEFLAPPEGLAAEELVVWSELREEYGDRLTEGDRTLFSKLVRNEATYRLASKKVMDIGALIKSPSGYAIQNPYLAIANKAEERALRTSVQLGLTPLARGRVKAHKNKSLRANPFAGLRTLDD